MLFFLCAPGPEWRSAQASPGLSSADRSGSSRQFPPCSAPRQTYAAEDPIRSTCQHLRIRARCKSRPHFGTAIVLKLRLGKTYLERRKNEAIKEEREGPLKWSASRPPPLSSEQNSIMCLSVSVFVSPLAGLEKGRSSPASTSWTLLLLCFFFSFFVSFLIVAARSAEYIRRIDCWKGLHQNFPAPSRQTDCLSLFFSSIVTVISFIFFFFLRDDLQ